MDNRYTGGSSGPPPGTTTPGGSDRLRAAMDDAKRSADAVAADVKDAASDLASQAKAAAAEAAEKTTGKVSQYAEQQRGAAAEGLARLSEATHAAADHLNEASPTMARYAHDLAGQMDRVADSVRESSVSDLVRTASDFARREPAVFVAGTVFAGFLVARFLRSSADRAERDRPAQGGWTGDSRFTGQDGGASRDFRPSSTRPGSMPSGAGTGRSYDPSRRYDERDMPGGGNPGAGRPGSSARPDPSSGGFHG
jgi:hypothetical protein